MRCIMTYGLIFVLVFGICPFLSAQERPDFESIIESIADDIEGEADYLSILENLEIYFEDPLNINTATEIDLLKLSLLNEIQISNLLEYRNKSGEIFSIYELNSIEGFNREILEKIAPFIKFESGEVVESTIKKPLKYGKHQLLLRSIRVLQEAKGYKTEEGNLSKYEGNPIKLYTRYRFQLDNKLSVGLTAEKDPGEALFSGSNKNGFDYYSGHVSVGFNSVFKNITVGDFQVRSGQGLAMWQGYSTGKSADVLSTSKNAQGIRPYTSTDENRYFRGIAAGFEFYDVDLILFYSKKKSDANVEFADTTDVPLNFISLQTSGLHRTENEIEDEKSITETSAGAVLSYQKNRLKVGATFYSQQFNLPLILSDATYNRFKFVGKENINAAIDYRYLTGKYQLFGEAAISKSKGMAFLQGAVAHLHDRANLTLLFRYFDKNYHSFFSNAFSESSSNINETGLYCGLKVLPASKLRFLAYTDFYKSPWISYTTMAPSSGYDALAQLEYIASNNFKMYLRFKTESKDAKVNLDKKYVNETTNTQKARINAEYNLTSEIVFRSRGEYISYKKYEAEDGFLICQDIVYTPENFPFRGYFRFAYFNTDSYYSRIYTYENDLLYNYSIPSFYGSGFRTYLTFTYKFSNFLDAWFKLSNTCYSDRESIGSGYNEVDGKNLTEVKFQLRLKF